MKNQFIKGLLTAAAYYAVGGLFVLAAYAFAGSTYAHGPGLHHVLLLAFWLGGCGWAAWNIAMRFTGRNVAFNRGAAFVNVVVCAAAFVVVQQELRSLLHTPAGTLNQQTVRTEFSGDTTLVRHNGNMVYLKIGDSVYLDELNKIYPSDKR